MMRRFLSIVCLLLLSFTAFTQGSEPFTNIPLTAPTSSYLTRSWTGNGGISWSSTDTRADQTITGLCAGMRNSTLTSGSIPNGIGNLTFNYKYLFTGSAGSLTIRVNGNVVGTVAVPASQTTATSASVNNINVAGAFVLEIQQTVSGQRVAIDDLAWTGFSGSCTAPATQATTASINTVTNSSFTINWVAGTGTNSLVVVKAGSAVSSTPTNGASYTANTSFGGGSTIGTGEYVVYNGAGNGVTVTNLAFGTTYHVAVFTFNSADNCYNVVNPARADAATLCAEPATQVTTINASPSVNTAAITWSGGTGTNSLVKINSTNSFTPPVDGVTYTANTTYGGGEQVIYNGSGTSANVSGLAAGTTYYVTVYTFNNCAGAPDYLVSGTAVQSFTTLTGGGGIPAGYYDPATGLTCANLKTALRNIINTGLTPRTYSDLWTIYLTADVQPSELGGGNVIWDMYSDNPAAVDPYEFTPGTNQCGTYNSEADCYNREHSFPQSWFGGGTTPGPGTDYHHIFPTDGYVNGQRSNFPYGTVGSASFTSLNGSRLGTSNTSGISGTVFEPINEYKGDFARAFLYMVTCYQNNMTAWETEDPSGDVAMDGTAWPSVEPDYLLLMKAWHNSDPVSQKEIDRNNAGYGFQGNRNPYVDHPEYVGLVWPASCAALPVQLVSFDARYEREQVKLDWRISDAAGFSHFEIERSEDGGRTYVKAGQVVWNTARTLYTYIDNAAALQGNVLYRLKLVDIDGSHTYSKLVKVKLPALDGIGLLYPNPAKDKLVVAFRKPVMISYKAVITDLSGKIIFISPLAIGQSLYELPVNRLASGTYVLKLVSSVRSWQEKFVVQR